MWPQGSYMSQMPTQHQGRRRNKATRNLWVFFMLYFPPEFNMVLNIYIYKCKILRGRILILYMQSKWVYLNSILLVKFHIKFYLPSSSKSEQYSITKLVLGSSNQRPNETQRCTDVAQLSQIDDVVWREVENSVHGVGLGGHSSSRFFTVLSTIIGYDSPHPHT